VADLALSKTLDPADFDQLRDRLTGVDPYFTRDREQHPMRRWEYAMALEAQARWYDATSGTTRPQGPVIDVGGAGSPFWRMVNPEVCRVVDPDGGSDLAEHLRLGAMLASEVYCLSVLEHVDDLDQFIYHLGCLVAPGGLLFLTVDHCDHPSHDADMEVASTPDQHHFHWMRKRIFGRWDLEHVAETLLDQSFSWLGDRDFTYHGHHVFDYSFCSLALVKRA
jgi:hypothetical protein